MKIICDKKEFCAIIRACERLSGCDVYQKGCSNCVLNEFCAGQNPEDLMEMEEGSKVTPYNPCIPRDQMEAAARYE